MRAGSGVRAQARTASWLAALFGLGVVMWVVLTAGVGEVEGPHVGFAVLTEALASTVPERPTQTDDIDHFEARLAARGDEALSHARLVGAYLSRFKAYGDRRDLEAAERSLEGLRNAGAADGELALAESALHLARHEFAAALASAEAAYRATGGADAAAVYRLFDALWAAGLSERAAQLLDRPIDTTTVAFMSRRARVLDRTGQVDAARARFAEIVELVEAFAEPPSVRGWALVEAGHLELHSGNPAAAVKRYREALQVLPGSPAALEGLAAVAYGVDRDLEAAARLYNRSLANGAHLDLMPLLATIERERGNAQEASRIEAEFTSVVLENELNERWFRRPLAQLLAGDEATVCQAIALAERDLEERRDPGGVDALAWALYGAGDVRGAAALAKEAVSVGVPEPPVAYHAGVIALANGDRREGRRLLKTALDGQVELTSGEISHARSLLEGEAPLPLRVECGRGGN
jgi:tetratricopeptide (TPR) repeat protein